jgi:hypothetical protein
VRRRAIASVLARAVARTRHQWPAQTIRVNALDDPLARPPRAQKSLRRGKISFDSRIGDVSIRDRKEVMFMAKKRKAAKKTGKKKTAKRKTAKKGM